jgi:ribosomal protein S18 acetylase RimI-like enzyme
VPVPRLQVRRACRADALNLAELAASTFRDTYCLISDPVEVDDYIRTNFTATLMEEHIAEDSASFILGCVAHRIIGYAHVRVSVAPECVTGPAPIELSRLYLEQAFHGQGYGSALMRASFREARERNGQTLWLSVYSENTNARAFYAAMGFVEIGTREFLFGGRTYNDPVMSRAIPRDT